MTAAEDGGTRLLVILRQQVLEHVLTGGVKEVERLVEHNNLGLVEEGGYDAHLLLVACREVANELFLSEYLIGSEALKVLQTLIDLGLRLARDLAKEGKILLGG